MQSFVALFVCCARIIALTFPLDFWNVKKKHWLSVCFGSNNEDDLEQPSQVPQPTYFSGATEQLSSGPPGTSGPLGPQGKILLYLLWSKNNSETAYLIYWWVQIVAKLTVCLYQIASTHDELESFPGSTILPILASQQCQFRSLCTKRGWSKNTLQWALLLSPFY